MAGNLEDKVITPTVALTEGVEYSFAEEGLLLGKKTLHGRVEVLIPKECLRVFSFEPFKTDLGDSYFTFRQHGIFVPNKSLNPTDIYFFYGFNPMNGELIETNPLTVPYDLIAAIINPKGAIVWKNPDPRRI